MFKRKFLSLRSGRRIVNGVDLIDTPRSCSVNKVSVYLNSLFSVDAKYGCVCSINASQNVV
jgi:hypothetical protein